MSKEIRKWMSSLKLCCSAMKKVKRLMYRLDLGHSGYFDRMVTKGLSEEVTFELRPGEKRVS